MTPRQFVDVHGKLARHARRATGVSAQVVLAQWAIETGWGTSALYKSCHNLAGIKYYGHPGTTKSGMYACYHDLKVATVDYEHTLNLPYYRAVREASTMTDEVAALGRSPWAESHYGKPPGVNLLPILHQIMAVYP